MKWTREWKWSARKSKWSKNGVSFIGRQEINAPEKYVEMNRQAESATQGENKANIMDAISEAFKVIDNWEKGEEPEKSQEQLEAEELMNEYLYLTPDAFAMRPDVSREVLMHFLTIYELHLKDERESHRYSFKRFKGGWRTGEKKKEAASRDYANIVSTYKKLRGEGQTDTQAVLSLNERGYGSDSKIRRALRAAKGELK